MKISVLTPTYNRSNLLSKLYQSLIENSQYGIEIEWIIIDDGSTDETKRKVKEFIKKEIIQIKYYKQENQGKMVAINNSLPYATGELIIECDSDDYFTKDAFEIIQKEYNKHRREKNIYGLCFLKYDQDYHNMGSNFNKKRTTMFDLYFKEGEEGEKAIVFYGDIRKKYNHQLEKKEKFITEARMYHKMDENDQIICINKPIMICKYEKDGYTKNIIKQFKENPYGYYQYFKEILQKDFKGIKFAKRLYVIKHYILFCYLTKQYTTKNIRNLENKLLYYMLLIPGIIKSKLDFK